MARTDNLNHFLTDIADAIRSTHDFNDTYKILSYSKWDYPTDTGIYSKGDLKIRATVGGVRWINTNTYFNIWGCDYSTNTSEPYSANDTTKRLNGLMVTYSGGTGSGYSGVTVKRRYGQNEASFYCAGFYYDKTTIFELDKGDYYYYSSNEQRIKVNDLSFTEDDFNSESVGSTIYVVGRSFYDPVVETTLYSATNSQIPVFDFKIWNADGELLGNFVPAYRTSDNVYGFYNRVDSTFHPNIVEAKIQSSLLPDLETGEVITAATSVKAEDFDKYTAYDIKKYTEPNTIGSSVYLKNILNFDRIPSLELNFQGYTSLQSLFSDFKYKKVPKLVGTGGVVTFTGLFQNANNIVDLDLSYLDISSGRQFNYMFNGCSSLVNIQLPTKGFPAVTNNNGTNGNFEGMFQSCAALEEVDLSTLNLPSTGTNGYYPAITGMFKDCKKLNKIILPANNIPVGSVTYLFYDCNSLGDSYLKAFWNKLDFKNVSQFSYMFYNCYLLESFTADFDTKVTATGVYVYLDYLLYGCRGLKSVNISATENSYTFNYILAYALGASASRGTSVEPDVLNVDFEFSGNAYIYNLSYAFSSSANYYPSGGSYGTYSDATLNIDFHDTELRISGNRPFTYCGAKVINVSNVRVGVTSGQSQGCTYFFYQTNAEEIHVINWDFGSYTTTVQYMFYNNNSYLKRVSFEGCTEVTLTTFTYFIQASHLEFLDIRCFILSGITSSVTNALNSVPTSCEIIVKDDTEKAWFNTKFPTYTNVKTVAEYEAQ